MENKLQFLKEYKELCLKHGFEIIGCGDCGSAWLEELGDEERKNNKLSWEGDFTNIQFADDFKIKHQDQDRRFQIL